MKCADNSSVTRDATKEDSSEEDSSGDALVTSEQDLAIMNDVLPCGTVELCNDIDDTCERDSTKAVTTMATTTVMIVGSSSESP